MEKKNEVLTSMQELADALYRKQGCLFEGDSDENRRVYSIEDELDEAGLPPMGDDFYELFNELSVSDEPCRPDNFDNLSLYQKEDIMETEDRFEEIREELSGIIEAYVAANGQSLASRLSNNGTQKSEHAQ